MTRMDANDELWFLELPRERIVELIWALEGHEGVAAPRVLSREPGIVELLVSPDLVPDLERILHDLNREFPVRRVARPEGIKSISDDPEPGAFCRGGEQ